jgi:transposase
MNLLHAYVIQAFPEYYKIFKRINSNASLEVLSRYASLSEFKRVRLETLKELIRKSSQGRHGIREAQMLKALDLSSIGIDSSALSFSIKQTIKRIMMIKQQVFDIEHEIIHHVDESQTTLLSVPGVGYTTGAIILAEIGDIHRFNTDDQLLAFAGLDPSVYQSGKFEGNYKISKRGSSILRFAIYHVAQAAVKFDPVFKAYYLKKKAEGKRHRVIIGHVTKKILRVIRSILKNNSIYSINTH